MSIGSTATHAPTNGIVLVGIAGFLGFVVYQGNLPALWQNVYADVVTKGFWKWALAVVILWALAANPTTNKVFGPVLVFVIVAMLIELEQAQPGVLANAAKGLQSFIKLPATPTAT